VSEVANRPTVLGTRLLLVDGSNLLMRAYFATKKTHLTNASGVPTAALSTFISMLSRYVRQEKPTHVMVCWDGGKSAHRVAIFSGYKAARTEKTEEDRSHFMQAKEFCRVAGVPQREVFAVEADDLVANYVREYKMFEQIVILSGDHDFFQLLSHGKVVQIRPKGGEDERWTEAMLRSDYGCPPAHFAKVIALAGDIGDNVPGIPGIGVKTAVKMLKRHRWNLDDVVFFEPKLFGRKEDLARNMRLVDLTQGARVEFKPIPRFEPVGPAHEGWQALSEFLDLYDLGRARASLEAGSMWSERVRPAPSPTGDGRPAFRRGGVLDPPPPEG